MHLLAGLTGCAGGDGVGVVPAPEVVWLAPTDGATVPAGEVSASVRVEGVTLVDPAKHNAGAPIGHLGVEVDGVEVLRSGATTFPLALDVGPHVLGVRVYYGDGDAVMVSDGVLCEGGDTGCTPVAARVEVTAE